uniref:Uncharacterized protein n=1 Tax=Knipowitschia caucasica TaxID=637954 RepID=A0AAV2KML2_KNICA
MLSTLDHVSNCFMFLPTELRPSSFSDSMGGRKKFPSPAPRATRIRGQGPAPASSTALLREDRAGPSSAGTPGPPSQAPRRSARLRTPPPEEVQCVDSPIPGPSSPGSSSSSSGSSSGPQRHHGLDTSGWQLPPWLHVWDRSRLSEIIEPMLPNLHHTNEPVWCYVRGSETMMVTLPWTPDSILQEIGETLDSIAPSFAPFLLATAYQSVMSNEM